MILTGVRALEGEEWRPVAGFEGKYAISNLGRVYSIPRRYAPHGGLLTISTNSKGYPYVSLRSPGDRGSTVHKVHRLLAEAFLTGPRAGDIVRHLNDIKTDNRLENLAWGTKSDNERDAVRNGRNSRAAKTHCLRGHEYTPETTYWGRRGTRRSCKPCQKMRQARMADGGAA